LILLLRIVLSLLVLPRLLLVLLVLFLLWLLFLAVESQRQIATEKAVAKANFFYLSLVLDEQGEEVGRRVEVASCPKNRKPLMRRRMGNLSLKNGRGSVNQRINQKIVIACIKLWQKTTIASKSERRSESRQEH
jgi:hypothetical protein